MASPSIVGLVLAAGASRRMGPDTNKLCALVDGKPLVAGPVDAMLEAGIDPVFVVTGYHADEVREALAARPCVIVEHTGWEAGMGASLAAGMRHLLGVVRPSGVLVCVGDLAGLEASWIEALLGTFLQADSADCICVPTCGGRIGHPVLFGRNHFDALCDLDGEAGGREILRAHARHVQEVAIEEEAIFRDLDEWADFEAWRERRPPFGS